MTWWTTALLAFAVVPVAWACWSNRRTALAHSLVWGSVAWLTWLTAAATGTATPRYLALVLTGCAGVAVLGARWPGVGAWHAVVGGLLAVLLLPLGQGFLADGPLPIDSIRTGFLGAALVIGLMNYVPTRLGLGAAALLAACLIELRWLDGNIPALERLLALGLAGTAPWLAWAGRLAWRSAGWEGDRLWRDFRDRFGVVWAQRLREQFNRAAANAGLPAELGWRSVYRPDGAPLSERDRAACLELMTVLMTRFGLP